MKNLIRRLVPGLLLLALLGSTALAQTQGRMATVDLRRVFDNYWKKIEAEKRLKEQVADIQKELRNMMDELKKAKDEYDSLVASANDPAISADEKDKRKKAAEDKLRQLKEMDTQAKQYNDQGQTRIAEQTDRMRNNIVKEITAVVTAKAKAAGYAMVFDSAAESKNLTPVLLYSNNENDMTDSVLAQLNAGRPEPGRDEKTEGKK